MAHYNSYQGLDTSTSEFSIHFALEPIGSTEPDLTDRGSTNSDFTPTTVVSGETSFDVWCDVENIGTASSGDFTVSYYASLYPLIRGGDYFIGTDRVSSIAPVGYADSSLTGIFPCGL